jgi:hypothetical protein
MVKKKVQNLQKRKSQCKEFSSKSLESKNMATKVSLIRNIEYVAKCHCKAWTLLKYNILIIKILTSQLTLR